ncbi:MAG: Gfo/Idh/MocA family oxidoreductase [Clostridia bacterium]|nr:Gfo/Idh/MocA family oxidoreductase [Clostridia bacterium]
MADIQDRFKENQDVQVIDTEKKLKIGIIGAGWIAEAHIDMYRQMPDVDIVAVADLIPGKARALCERYGVEGVHYYLSGHEMLEAEKLDAVSVCTYNTQHAPCAIDALEHGCHVLLEKPFTVTLDEAIEVMKAEKKSGKILSLGFQPRMAVNMQMIKKIVDSGELGKVYYLQAGGGRRSGIPTPYGTTFIEKETGGIGAIGDIGTYSLDMLLHAVGDPKPLTVSGYTSNFFGVRPDSYPWHPEYAEKFGVDDFAAGFIRLEGGIILDFRISWAMHMDTCGDALILGTEGALRIPSTECWNGDFPSPLKVYKKVAGQEICYEVPRCDDDNFGKMFYGKVRSFLDAIKNGGTAPVPSSQIVYNQAIIDGIVRSNELGREIEIDIPEI